MSVAIAVGLVTAAAVYLFMQRGMIRIVLGFVLISHAANLLLFSAGNSAFRGIPYIGAGDPSEQADPLPQAFVLTAIVIAFSITMFMVTLAITTTGDDDTEREETPPVQVIEEIATGELTTSTPAVSAEQSVGPAEGSAEQAATTAEGSAEHGGERS